MIVAVIPARMSSSRFPGKPMALIRGIPMVGHVLHRTSFCSAFDDIWVATCDPVIDDYVKSIGGKSVLTGNHHERASERVTEAVEKIEAKTNYKIDHVAMIQGDEPLVMPEMLEELVQPALAGDSAAVINLIQKISSDEEFLSPDIVKLVRKPSGEVIYFSREPIPSKKKYKEQYKRWKQLGLILFRRDALFDFIKLQPTPLEIIESVDMNRFIEHGRVIKTVETVFQTYSVDTPKDLQNVEMHFERDPWFTRYQKVTGLNEGK
ncbi:MAG TPA: 3-deoxy-manno-octulosonate cytidylyltransferase [Bdellovibrionota bacterium]|nr:3-deoxy-manno-octulosonate cytidylyltransferase [Bdellovibrionota bacterium]